MPVVQDYIKYTKKWKKEYGEKTLVLMQVGSFFEVYGLRESDGSISGSNISDFSQLCDMLIAKKSQKVDGKQVLMAGFGVSQIEKYIKKLQEAGYTIAIYTQDMQAKNTTRSLEEIISPGTYFSTDTRELSNNVMCVWLYRSKASKYSPSLMNIGIANIDNITGKSTITQFKREYYKDSCTYDDLERQISIFSPYECIVVAKNIDMDHVNDIAGYVGLSNIKTHIVDLESKTDMAKHASNAEKQIYQNEIMNRFFKDISPELFTEVIRTHDFAIQAFTMLIDFIYQHNPNMVNKISFPFLENYTERLLLANHSLRQLNIIDDNRYNGKLSSVANLLNNCVTNMGKRSFMYNITSPTTNVDNLNKSYSITNHLIEFDNWKPIREKLYGVSDLDKFSRKLVYRKLSPKDLVRLYEDLTAIENTHEHILYDAYLSDIIEMDKLNCILKIREIKQRIEENFDLEKCEKIDDISNEKLGMLTPTQACFVKQGINNEIDDTLTTSEMSSKRLEALRMYFSDMVGGVEKSKRTTTFIKIHETPKADPVLMGTSRRVKILKTLLQDKKEKTVTIKDDNGRYPPLDFNLSDLQFTTLGSNKKDLIITSPLINKVARNIQKSRDELINKLARFFNEFIASLLEIQSDIDTISKFTSWADNYQNKCYIATKYNYCRPVVYERSKPFFSVEGLRHPLIEQLQTNELYVTNDLSLGEYKDGLLLYGTNAVGKTSFIRAVGISIVMAQAGLYVPCSIFFYKPYDKIFTRILGNDNLFKGLSTFAVEMSELRTILTLSDENSIVIGDELCSGTESDSARSIFTAGVEWLHNTRSTFMFATHFHEINDYEEMSSLERVKMMHMAVTYDKQKDLLIYDRKLRDGPGDNMYGLEVCKALNLPDDFLSRAHAIRMKYDPKTTNILAQKKTRYNAKKLKGSCEICGAAGEEVHHLKHQASADVNQFIKSHHKNHTANLVNLCETCHNKIHEEGGEHKIVKTSKGYQISKIE